MAVCRADSFECTTTAGCRLLFPPSIKGCVKLCRRCISKTRSSSSYLHGLTTQALLSVVFYFSFRPAFQEVGEKKLRVVCICSWKQEKLKAIKHTHRLFTSCKFPVLTKGGGRGEDCEEQYEPENFELLTIWWWWWVLGMLVSWKNALKAVYVLKKNKYTSLLLEQGATTPREKSSRRVVFFYRDILASPLLSLLFPFF